MNDPLLRTVIISTLVLLLGLACLLESYGIWFGHPGLVDRPKLFLNEPGGLIEPESRISRKSFHKCIVSDQQLGWFCRPLINTSIHLDGQEARFSFRTDQNGFRDRPRNPKKEGTFRLITLGGSSTFGWGVDGESTWPAILDAFLAPDAECINLAMYGYGTDQALFTYKHLGYMFIPDAVVVSVSSDDPEHVLADSRLIGDHEVKKPRFDEGENALYHDIERLSPSDRHNRGRDLVFDILLELEMEVSTIGAGFYVLSIPFNQNLPEAGDLENGIPHVHDHGRFFSNLVKFGEDNNIIVIDPRKEILDCFPPDALATVPTGHSGRVANSIIAQAVEKSLKQE